MINVSAPRIVTRSLNVKYGWNGSRSAFPDTPSGLDDPCSCRASRCIAARAASTNGSRK